MIRHCTLQRLAALLLLVVGSQVAHGQSTDGGQNTTGKSSFSLPANAGQSGANVEIGGVPVNLYTGNAAPSVSLYAMPGRNLTVPIALTYTAGNGVQVRSQASDVGTGWQLSAGGEISCEVRGTPDELASDKDWLAKLANHDNDKQPLRSKICAGDDSEYDIYHANCAGLQVNFVIRRPSNPSYTEVFVLNNRTVAVTPTYASWGNTNAITSFTITDGEGTQYVFDETAKITVTSSTVSTNVGSAGATQLWPATSQTYTASWKLSRITSRLGENAYFTYNVESAATVVYKNFMSRSWPTRCDYQGNNCVVEAPRGSGRDGAAPSPTYETTTTVTQAYAFRLAYIFTDIGNVQFIRGHARRDKPGEYALTEVRVNGPNSALIKRFLLDYGYFGNSPGASADQLRLKLTQVKELATGCATTATQFEYQELFGMDRIYSPCDYWGYPTYGGLRATPGAPNATAMQNYLLRRITSNLGSTTELAFEPHLDKNGALVGGVRLKTVTVRDGYKAAADQVFTVAYTVFDRNNPATAGGSSAEAVAIPKYEDMQLLQKQQYPCWVYGSAFYTYRFTSSEAMEPIAPDYIGYKWVSVKYPNGSRAVYKFTNQADFPDEYNSYSIKLSTDAFNSNAPCADQQVSLPPAAKDGCYNYRSELVRGDYPVLPQTERPFGVLNSSAHRRGVLLEQYEVDSENRLMAVTENTYDFTGRDVVLRSAVIAREQQVFAYAIYNFFYNVKFRDIEREWVPLKRQLITTYDQRRGNTQATQQRQQLTIFGYANYMLASTEVSNPAGGATYRTLITRVADYTPSPFTPSWQVSFPLGVGGLYYGHSLATVVATEQYVKPDPAGTWTLTSEVEKEYLFRNSVTLLKRTNTVDYAAGGQQAPVQYSVQDVEYDDKNNLVNVLGNDGLWTGIVWGYNKLLPVASVSGGRVAVMTNGSPGLATAGHTSFEHYADDDWSLGGGTFYQQEAKTGEQSVLLSLPNNVYGPGKVFTLPPDAQHGKYNFSCWAKVPKNESSGCFVAMVMYITMADGTTFWRGPGAYINNNQEWQLCRGVLDLEEASIRSALTNSQNSGKNITIQCYPWLPWGNGNLLVDEVRFHPASARMSTTTFRPLVGKTSTTDENQVTTYYLYDTNNQLRLVKDAKGNVVKRMQSHVATALDLSVQVAQTGGNLYPGTSATFTATTPDCTDGVTYTWNFGDGATQKGGAQQNHTYSQTGTYQLTVVAEAPDANPVEATLTVSVVNALTVEAAYDGSTYYDPCDRSGNPNASITAVASGGCGTYTYRWETRDYQFWNSTWGPWTTDGNTRPTYSYYHSGQRYLQVHCTVTDACGNVADLYDSFYTEPSNPNCGGSQVRTTEKALAKPATPSN